MTSSQRPGWRRRLGYLVALGLVGAVAPDWRPSASLAATGTEIAIGDAAIHEGDAGAKRSLQFAVSLSSPHPTVVTAKATITSVSAAASSDYTGTPTRTVTFSPGQTMKYVSVSVQPDVVGEGDETLLMTLGTPIGGAVLGRSRAVGTIYDDDVATGVRLAIGDASVVEGDAGSHRVKVWVNLSGPAPIPVTFTVTTADGSAAAGPDFVAVSKNLSFATGSVKKVITLTLVSDTMAESTETFGLNVGSVVGAAGTDTQATITVHDDDGAVQPGLEAPGSTNSIQLVSTTQMSGFQIEYYRNLAYPCSISGHQTFLLAYPIGLANATARPLWTHMHGGGVGWFDVNGQPQPDAGLMTEESLTSLIYATGLNLRVLTDPAGFRMVSVSYCNRDIYAGGGFVDPNNPNLLPGGSPRNTNGLLATKAAIQFALGRFTTSKYFISGTSAGSAGAMAVGWAMQRQGLPAAGIIGDSYVVNSDYVKAIEAQSIVCPGTGVPMTAATLVAVGARLHPELADPLNEPDLLVSSGRLTVPLLHVWSEQDPFGCDGRTMQCPLRGNATVSLGGMDCMNERLRRAIAAQGASSRSLSLGLCVQGAPDPVLTCNRHVVTSTDGVNTDPAWPADYNDVILDWVHERLLDAP